MPKKRKGRKARQAKLDRLYRTQEWRNFAARAKTDMAPKMKSSHFVCSFFTGDFDAKLAIEMGTAMLMDKPIVVMVAPGSKCPEKLIKIADKILELNMQDKDESGARLAAAIEELRAEGKVP